MRDQHVDAITAPEQFAVEGHGRYAEDAECFGAGVEPVVYPLGPLHGEPPARWRSGARVHIGATHLAPEMRCAFFHLAPLN